jgi:hypothetical protein
MTTTVAAQDVASHLARHRPPTHVHVSVRVPPHRETPFTRHECIVATALCEQLAMWSRGIAMTIDYELSGYAQSLAYPPSILAEIGALEEDEFRLAIARGWIDPATIPPNNPNFASQPVWADNPIREWRHPPTAVDDIAVFLVHSVRAVLGRDPYAGFDLSLFNNHIDDEGDGSTNDDWDYDQQP